MKSPRKKPKPKPPGVKQSKLLLTDLRQLIAEARQEVA
jgi:hypothetical protein